MKAIAFIIFILSSLHVSANQSWVDVFDSYNSALNKADAYSATTLNYQKLFGKRGFKRSNIVSYDYRRFTVGDEFGLLLLENIETKIPAINEIYQKMQYKQGVLLKNEGKWLVERVFEPKTAALEILIDTPDWSLNNIDSNFEVDQKSYQFKSAVAFQNPDGSVWVDFYPFKIDDDDLDALAWGENTVTPVLENKATTIASTASYQKFFMHIPDVDNLSHDVTVGFFNLNKEGHNATLKGRGKEFLKWAQIKEGMLIVNAKGFLPTMTPVVSVNFKLKIPVWRRGIKDMNEKIDIGTN